MRELTKAEQEMAAQLFAQSDSPLPHKGEGKTHLTVRFDSTRPGVVYFGPHARKNRIRIPGAVVLSYALDTSNRRNPQQRLRVRTEDGRKWVGTVKSGTDVVILRNLR